MWCDIFSYSLYCFQSCHILLYPVRSYHILLYPVRSCHILLYPVRSCHILLYPVRSCHILLYPVRSCHILLYPVLPCTLVYCHVLLCHVLFCHVLFIYYYCTDYRNFIDFIVAIDMNSIHLWCLLQLCLIFIVFLSCYDRWYPCWYFEKYTLRLFVSIIEDIFFFYSMQSWLNNANVLTSQLKLIEK